MPNKKLNLFSPVALATETLGKRWTLDLIRELCGGARTLDEFRAGVPKARVPSLERRLEALENFGVIDVSDTGGKRTYKPTESGQELCEVLDGIGIWARKWLETQDLVESTDPRQIMRAVSQSIRSEKLPERPVVIQFTLLDLNRSRARNWILHTPGAPPEWRTSSIADPVDIFVSTTSRTLLSIWLGRESMADALARDEILLAGDRDLQASISQWFAAGAQV
jgi:DNA-binding HxlR family transcriptional regulator